MKVCRTLGLPATASVAVIALIACTTGNGNTEQEQDQLKRMGYFVHAVEAITKTDYGPDLNTSNPNIRARSNVNPDTKTQFVLLTHADTTSTTDDHLTFSLSGTDGTYTTLPQSGSIEVNGREAKMLVAGYDLGAQRWVYSTSEIMTHAKIGGRDVALVHGATGQEGETVLRYATAPKVTVQSGDVTATWDSDRKDLRLNYRHTGLARVRIEGGARPLDLLIADTASSAAHIMAYFTESPSMTGADYGLHLAVSSNGLDWTPLNQNNAVVTPTQGTGGLRDPYILRKQDGSFVVLATDLKGTDWSLQNQYIHIWDSSDLRSFTNYRRIKMHSMETHSWAPEAFWDASRGQYGIIYSAASGGHDVIMVNYTTDFVTVSAPQVFFDPGYQTIDGNLVTANGVHYLYFKNNTNSTILGARSTSLNPGSFSIYTTAIAPGRGVEAPQIVKSLNQDVWYMWGDTWSPNGRFFAWQTSNLASGSWTASSDRTYTQPLNSKHLGITPITAAEMSNLITHWGSPNWKRIKSYNYPDRYVRHADNVGRIDTYPFDPYPDQQWKIVPGLADSAGMSFQSVNFPNMYLRHDDFAVVLRTNDGSALFGADATFYRVSGFADSGWTSFRSYNYPDRYIRHANGVLRVAPITSGSSTTDKEDATFREVY